MDYYMSKMADSGKELFLFALSLYVCYKAVDLCGNNYYKIKGFFSKKKNLESKIEHKDQDGRL